jgi:hypothetical protein
MNLNAPLQASNLNNPCPKLHLAYNQYLTTNKLEACWTDNTTHPEINLCRHLASQRALSSGLALTESYDFLDPTYTGPRTAKLPISTLEILRNRGSTEQASLAQQDFSDSLSTSQFGNQSGNNQCFHSIPQQTNLHVHQPDDEISTISHQTGSMSLSHQAPAQKRSRVSTSSSTTNPSPPRIIPTHTQLPMFINFTVPIHESADNI